jgi:hypothetical protein
MACTLPTFVAGVPRGVLPDGGVLAAEEAVIDVRADGGTGAIIAHWEPRAYPLAWERTIALTSDDSLTIGYAVSNAQGNPVPFVWSLDIPVPWREAMAMELSRGGRARVASARGEGLPRSGSEFTWPALRDGGKLVDLSTPTHLMPRNAVSVHVELAREQILLRVDDSLLELSSSDGVISHAHLAVNNDADAENAPPRRWWRKHQAVQTIVAGPSAGAPSSLAEAVGAWNAARWVEPGATVRWSLQCRATTISST